MIYTCRESDVETATNYFDTRQYPYLTWTGPADLRTTLCDRFRALGIALKYA